MLCAAAEVRVCAGAACRSGRGVAGMRRGWGSWKSRGWQLEERMMQARDQVHSVGGGGKHGCEFHCECDVNKIRRLPATAAMKMDLE